MSDSSTSFLAELLDDAIAAGEKSIPGLIEPLVARAAANGSLVVAKLPVALQPIARQVLDKIAAAAPAVLGDLSQKAVIGLVSKLQLGQGEEAQLLYLAKTASHAERMAALDQDSAATRKQAGDRNAAWQRFKGFVEDLSLTAGKALIPILMAL